MLTTWRRYAERHSRATEAVFLLLLFAAAGPASQYASHSYSAEGLGWFPGQINAAVACVAVLWRHRCPRTVVAVTAVCASASGGLGYLITPLLLAPVMVALYQLAVRASRRTTQGYCLGVIALIVLTALLADDYGHPLLLKTLGPAFWLVVPALTGAMVQTRRAYIDEVRARAEHAERTREEEARHRVAEERVRIARELHDVVAHHLALANAQAGTAAHLVRNRPEQAERILVELAGTTSSALRELKATVGLLRRPEDPEAPLEPSPGLDRLPELVTAFGGAGLDVAVTTEGEARPLSPGVDLTAFRIVQEALTNVAKHAGVTRADVRLAYGPRLLRVTVTNDRGAVVPGSPPSASGGFGVMGMRERARSVGGTLRADPRPDGGFTVAAELPLTV
ncbi:sensor histidine kinase [Yinghuangia sp. ASG 101]|uniref:sensor histidine kinase n=1 Tax=Yinghuangia sp. ASG 101 TaxID=2896848 RepID=UPI001E4C86BB|nr:sensor histidine kinase [Yinghuangia sp. ASG 101]UGQ12826.1 sensor histidine kinase [Yinghuangia sp. ASG 101]